MSYGHIVRGYKNMNLVTIAKEILEIKEYMDGFGIKTNHIWQIKMFTQTWGNTSGGFEGAGFCAMTSEMTYVVHNYDDVYVFFGGKFAYKVKMTSKVKKDIEDENMQGKSSYKERYEIEQSRAYLNLIHKGCAIAKGMKVIKCDKCGKESVNYVNGVDLCKNCCEELELCCICGEENK